MSNVSKSENIATLMEKALRLRWRFETAQGNLSIEDLWNLDLTNNRPGKTTSLDSIAIALSKELNSESEVSFVSAKNPKATILTDKLEIVKHIIAVRLEERQATNARQAKAQAKARILEAMEARKDENLKSMTLQELEAELTKLDS